MKKFTFLFIIFCAFVANQAFAQFTGKVVYSAYNVENGQKQKDNDDSATLYITPQRIYIQSSDDIDLGGSMDAKGVLIRLDKNDLLILKGNNQAMQLSKSSIISFMNMAAAFAKQSKAKATDNGPDVSIKKTGKTKTINGYQCEQFIIREKDEPNKYSTAWMTKDLNINLGFLNDIVAQAKKSFGETGEVVTNVIFKEGYFPVAGKEYKNNKVDKVFKMEITPTSSAKSHVKVPAGLQIMSMQQYMMQMMQNMQNDSSN